jgi:hypothetical protein
MRVGLRGLLAAQIPTLTPDVLCQRDWDTA